MPKFIIYKIPIHKNRVLNEYERMAFAKRGVEEILKKNVWGFIQGVEQHDAKALEAMDTTKDIFSAVTLLVQIDDEGKKLEKIFSLETKHNSYYECTVPPNRALWKSPTLEEKPPKETPEIVIFTSEVPLPVERRKQVFTEMRQYPDTHLTVYRTSISSRRKHPFCVVECDCTNPETIEDIKKLIKHNLNKNLPNQDIILVPTNRDPMPPKSRVVSERDIYNLSKELMREFGDEKHRIRYDSSFPIDDPGKIYTRMKKGNGENFLKIKDTIELLIIKLSEEVKKSNESSLYRFFNDIHGTKKVKLKALESLNSASSLGELKMIAQLYKKDDKVMYGINSRTAKIINTLLPPRSKDCRIIFCF